MLAFNWPKLGEGKAPKLIAALKAGRSYEGEYIGPLAGIYNEPGAWKEPKAIRTQWEDINKVGKKVEPGLTTRRRRETNLFFDGVYFGQ